MYNVDIFEIEYLAASVNVATPLLAFRARLCTRSFALHIRM